MAPKVSRCSPFWLRISGARIITFDPTGWLITASTICDGVWLEIVRPQTQQCGVPTRANSTRR
jgi:hypothetical protein